MSATMERVPAGYECKSCGDTRPPDDRCSRCGGSGMIEMWDPDDCPQCGCSGIQWPPVCRGCSKYRKVLPLGGGS